MPPAFFVFVCFLHLLFFMIQPRGLKLFALFKRISACYDFFRQMALSHRDNLFVDDESEGCVTCRRYATICDFYRIRIPCVLILLAILHLDTFLMLLK
jgi:hypothetical protein